MLVGGGGPLSLRAATAYGDEWMPIIDGIQTFQEQQAEMHRLCDEAGRPHLPVTVCPWTLDGELMARFAEVGTDRLVTVRPDVGDVGGLQRFLDDYVELGRRVGVAPQ